jgi:hypothetical protein
VRFKTLHVCLALSLGVTPACSPTEPSRESRRADVADPSGDVPASTAAIRHPDLIRATIEIESGLATFTVRFAPGTFDADTSRTVIYLDVDETPATGIPAAPGLTVDYWVEIVDGAASVSRCVAGPPGACTVVEQQTAAFTADSVDVTLPLSALGDDDGRMGFRIVSNHEVVTGTPDYLPNVSLAPGRVR